MDSWPPSLWQALTLTNNCFEGEGLSTTTTLMIWDHWMQLNTSFTYFCIQRLLEITAGKLITIYTYNLTTTCIKAFIDAIVHVY